MLGNLLGYGAWVLDVEPFEQGSSFVDAVEDFPLEDEHFAVAFFGRDGVFADDVGELEAFFKGGEFWVFVGVDIDLGHFGLLFGYFCF